MRPVKIIKYEDILEPESIEIVAEIVRQQGIIAYPTDTLYGLGGDFFSSRVHGTIDDLKGRSDLPYSVCISGLDMLPLLSTEIPDIFFKIYERLLPGKFTLLIRASSSIPVELLRGSPKIGIRLPAMPKLLELIALLRTPLISTSVNRSGETPLADSRDIKIKFPRLALIIEAGLLTPSRGSTVLDLTETPPRVLRPGDDLDRLRELDIPVQIPRKVE